VYILTVYFNSSIALVPLDLVICPSFPDNIYGETYGKVE